MESVSMSEFDARLERLEASCKSLERRCRAWRRLTAGLGLAAVTALIVGAGRDDVPTKRVEAQQFVLTDRDGKPRASLGIEPSGSPMLTLMDPLGKTRAKLGLRDDGSPLLLLLGTKTEAGLSFSVSGQGNEETPDLAIFDRGGAGGVQMTILRDGSPSISLHDEKGVARLSEQLTTRGAPSLKLLSDNQKGMTLASLGIDEDGKSQLIFQNAAGEILQKLPVK